MTIDTSVKFFTSDQVGANVLSGTAGALIAILDQCLKDGFGLKTVDTLVVAAGIATMNISTGHIYKPGQIVLMAGSTPTGLNGEKKVITIGTNFATFDATGISDQTATGTITAKLAPLGFTKPYAGTNLAAYRSSDTSGTQCYLRVDDTGTTAARIVAYETMSDVNTGVNPFPLAAQISGGLFWSKSSVASSAARNWMIIGDSRCFYYVHAPGASAPLNSVAHFFGDILPSLSTDTYECFINGAFSDYGASAAIVTTDCAFSPRNFSIASGYTQRSVNGLIMSNAAFHVGQMHNGSGSSEAYSGAGGYTTLSYPNDGDNAMLLGRTGVLINSSFRGTMPGIYHILQDVTTFLSLGTTLPGSNDLAGRTLYASKHGFPGTASSGGLMLFDITGPWR